MDVMAPSTAKKFIEYNYGASNFLFVELASNTHTPITDCVTAVSQAGLRSQLDPVPVPTQTYAGFQLSGARL